MHAEIHRRLFWASLADGFWRLCLLLIQLPDFLMGLPVEKAPQTLAQAPPSTRGQDQVSLEQRLRHPLFSLSGAIASSLAKGLTNPLGKPVETNSWSSICSQSSSARPSVSSAMASAENIKTLHEGSHGGAGQINPMLESQLLPPAQERSLLMSSRDDIQLPENLLTELPDFEDLVSSMEPLLLDSIIPSLDPTEPRDSGQAQELLATPPQPCDDTGGPSQEPQAKKGVARPRPSQGKPSEAPDRPKFNTKAKRGKSPASEEEPSRKGRKTNKSSDPTTSGEGMALGAHKKPRSSLVSGKNGFSVSNHTAGAQTPLSRCQKGPCLLFARPISPKRFLPRQPYSKVSNCRTFAKQPPGLPL
nr:uncharacterized protein LOC110077069 [Pogona vitticeps]